MSARSPAPSGRLPRWSSEVDRRSAVLLAAVALVLVQTGWRAWASASSWWYADDLELLDEARRGGLTLGALVAPHDSQLMPFGRLLAWLAVRAGDLAWWPGALQLVVLQLAAGLAAVWMLVRVFGARPAVLAPLALYLFSPMTLTAYMWWAAAVNQVPMHLAFFLAVGCHVTFVRTGRVRWALLAALAVTFGLTAYVKAVLILPVLLLLSLGPLADGGARARLRTALGQWRGWAVHGILGLVYVVVYTTRVPSLVTEEGDPVAWTGLFRTMVVESLGTTLVGGPWRWSDAVLPVQLVDPPAAGVVLSWLVVAAVVVAGVVRSRRPDLRTAPVSALVLAVGWVGTAYVLAALGRSPVLGALVGLELRYLADSAMVLALAVGLLWIPVTHDPATATTPGSPAGPPAGRTGSGHAPPAPVAVLVAAAVVVALVGAGWTSARYVDPWHGSYAVRGFVANAQVSADERPRTIADTEVPEDVMTSIRFPTNLPSRMLGSLPRYRAVPGGNDLEVLTPEGSAAPAAVDAGAESPPGPREGCGYLVTDSDVEVPVRGRPDYFWWASVSYLAEKDTTTTLTMGANRFRVTLLAGLHTVFVSGEGGYGPVTIAGTTDAPVCVDAVRVGDLVPVEEAS